MPKRGLPSSVKMRHDSHYVEELLRSSQAIGKILPIEKIAPNPEQPRTEIGDLTELSSSIKEKGVLEPLLVKPKPDGTWMIIAGERRWRAANLAGLDEVPCIELDLDEKEIAEIALIENMQRKDLTVWEEADGLAALKSRYDYSHEEIAKKIGKSRTTVTESLTIAGLPKQIREKCRRADISAKSILLEIARQFDEEAMHSFLQDISKNSAARENVRQTARPSKKTKSAAPSATLQKTASGTASDSASANIFSYESEKNDFQLKLTFNNGKFERKDVLRALKEAFENIKSKSEI